jgi:hypothetical protein
MSMLRVCLQWVFELCRGQCLKWCGCITHLRLREARVHIEGGWHLHPGVVDLVPYERSAEADDQRAGQLADLRSGCSSLGVVTLLAPPLKPVRRTTFAR